MNLEDLIKKCNNFHLTVNDHRTEYMTVSEYLSKLETQGMLDQEDVHDDVVKKMIENDTLIELQVYPHTPCGFIYTVHYDLQMAIDFLMDG